MFKHPTTQAFYKKCLRFAHQLRHHATPLCSSMCQAWSKCCAHPNIQRLSRAGQLWSRFGQRCINQYLHTGNITLPLRVLKQVSTDKLQPVITLIAMATIVANLLSLLFPLTLLQIYDRIIPNEAISSMIMLATIVVVAIIAESILRICQTAITQWLDAKFEYYYGTETMRTITHMPIQAFREQSVGSYLEKFDQLQKSKNFYACQALTAIINLPFILVFLFLIAFIGGWLVCAPIGITLIISILLFKLSNTTKDTHEAKMHCNSRLTSFIVNMLNNIHYIKAQALESQTLRRYEKLYEQKSKLTLDEWKTHALQLTRQLGSQAMILFVAFVGAPLVISQHLSVGGLAACIILASRCVQPLNTAASAWVRLQTVKLVQDTLDETLVTTPQEDPNATHTITEPPHIRLENLTFTQQGRTLLNNINLNIAPHSCIGITGMHGSGKSTLLQLLMHEQQPTQGVCTINTHALSDIKPASLHACISYIPEKATLYQDSIMENLTEYNDQKTTLARQIAAQLGLLEHIEHMPDGFQTQLNPQALCQMPLGMQQLIHIARGLIRDSEVVIFDEANARLSLRANTLLTQLLRTIKGSKTLIFVTHTPTLMALVDQHYNLHNGQLHEVPHA